MVKKEKRGGKSSILKELTNSLIGIEIRIIRSSTKEWEEKKGIIIDETHNMLLIKLKNTVISIPKVNQVFELKLRDGSLVQIEGHLLEGYPEHRIKRKWKSW